MSCSGTTYPYRPHELNAAALVLAKGAEKVGIRWAPTPLATISAPRGLSPPCVYRGFCVNGCVTNAKQSAPITWVPRAVAAGAEVCHPSMVGRIESDAKTGLVTGVHYYREFRWRFSSGRKTSSLPAMRSRRPAVAELGRSSPSPTGWPIARAWSGAI